MTYFLKNEIRKVDFEKNSEVLNTFAKLDDYDILSAIKVWQESDDKILSILSSKFINRKLFKIEIAKEPFAPDRIQLEKEMVKQKYNLDDSEAEYFIYSDILTNNAYNQDKQNINLLMKNGEVKDVSKASDNLNISALAKPVEKYFLCYML